MKIHEPSPNPRLFHLELREQELRNILALMERDLWRASPWQRWAMDDIRYMLDGDDRMRSRNSEAQPIIILSEYR